MSAFISGCTQPIALLDPYAFAPCLPNAFYHEDREENTLISSAYFRTYLPKNYDKQELSLAELIDIALYNNPKTKASWAQARAKAAVYGQAQSAYLPTIASNVLYKKERSTFTLSEETTTAYRLATQGPELQLKYTLLDFGRRKSSTESALQGLLFSDFSHNRTLQSAVKIVMQDYYAYLYEKEVLVSLEANLKNAKRTLAAAKEKAVLGIFAKGDIAQAKTAFIQAKIQVIRQKRAVSLAFSKLAKDMGIPANTPLKVEPLPEKIVADAMVKDVEYLVQQAQELRFDLQAAIANVAQKKADVSEAKAAYAPHLYANFDIGKYWYNHNRHEDYHWNLVFKMDIPIFEGFFTTNTVREKHAALEKSAAQLLEKELAVISEVRDAHAAFLSAKESLSFSEQYVEEANIQFTIALENYKAGTSTILDLLSAQSSFADAKAKLAEAKKNWYGSLAEIAYSTGALAQNAEEQGVL